MTNRVRSAGEWIYQRLLEHCGLTDCSELSIDPVEETPPAAETIDPRYEQLAWAIGKLIQQQGTLATTSALPTKQ